jgi:hypothetical protein
MRKFPRVSRKAPLTDRFLRALKAPDGRIEVSDASCRGLSIRCTRTGVKSWTFAYKLNGRMRRITLGEFPALGLSEARTQPTSVALNAKRAKTPEPFRTLSELSRRRRR